MFIGMIWRPTPDRTGPFNLAREFWANYGPVRFFDSGHPAFNRAASRNLAVRQGERSGSYKMVIADADCIPDPDGFAEACEQADDTAIHLPYTTCVVHDRHGKELGEFGFTCGGIYITTSNAWWGLGGQDERFTKWAPEDMAFSLAHETIYGKPLQRHPGKLISLGHEADPDRHEDTDDDPLVQLYRRYEAANGDRAKMEALCFPWS